MVTLSDQALTGRIRPFSILPLPWVENKQREEPVIPSAAELNTKKYNMQTLRQLCDDVGLNWDGRRYAWDCRRYALVGRLNQHRDYRAYIDLVGPGIPSAADLKNTKKHSIQNLRKRCAELGLDSDGSRYEVVARLQEELGRLKQEYEWYQECAQIYGIRIDFTDRLLNPNLVHIGRQGFEDPDGAPTTSGNPNQPPAPMQCGATKEGLCALHGSSENQVTRSADGHEAARPPTSDPGRLTLPRNNATTTSNISSPFPALNPLAPMHATQNEETELLDRPSITCGRDLERPNGPPPMHMHPTHPTLPCASTTENISVSIPPLNPLATKRATQDEKTNVLDRPLTTCGWDPGHHNETPLTPMHPLPRNDATTTMINRVQNPPLKSLATTRATQDEINAALDRPSIICGWDPGHPPLRNAEATTEMLTAPIPPLKSALERARQDEDHDRSSPVICGWDPGNDEANLSECDTIAYTDDGGTFADDSVVAAEIRGNGLLTTDAVHEPGD